uniref:Apple domain-containing protein n=1 Tax=Romanomermis culicivorax TaxID=13658 RepID=A0A915JX69_ROMCU
MQISSALALLCTLSTVIGQCNVDLNCWQTAAGCTLADGFPFERRTPTTCDECVQLCQKKQQGQYPYICKSAVWDCRFKTCDLFAVQATNPQRLTKYKDRTYFQYECLVSAPSADQCGIFCVQNQDDKGQPFACKAAQFSQGTCTLYDQAPTGDTTKNIKAGPDDKALYLEKKCYPADQAGNCPSIVLDPHHVIVGQNRKTVDASSYDQCLQQCLQTTEFKCKSGQYYADVPTDNCVLNEETRQTKSDLYLATDDNNIYFEPKCVGAGRKLIFSAKKVRAKLSLRDIPFELGEWTLWTECKTGKTERHRYRNCKEESIHRCPKEMQPCSPEHMGDKNGFISKLLHEEQCEHVQVEIKGQKKKRCDLGYVYHSNGTRTYCVPKTKPTDCIDLSVSVKA